MPSTENINININSNFQTVNQQSTDMRKQIRELRKEFYSLEEGTAEYNAVLEKLSKLQLDYTDATIVMRNSANDLGQRLTNLVKVSGDLMSGFSAAQGALALFGVESENFENVMIRLQAAIAIVQGLEGLEGMIDHMKALKASFSGILRPVQSFITMISNWVKFGKQATTTTQAQATATRGLASATTTATVATGGLSAAMVALRTALISTGIGALVVAIGAAIGALTNWIAKNRENKESLDEMNQSIEESKNATQEWTQRYEEALVERQKLEGTYDPVKVLEAELEEQKKLSIQYYNDAYNAQLKYTRRKTEKNKKAAEKERAERKAHDAMILALEQELANARLKQEQENNQKEEREREAARQKRLEEERRTLEELSQLYNIIAAYNLYGYNTTVNDIIESWLNFYDLMGKAVKEGEYTVEESAIITRDVFNSHFAAIDDFIDSLIENLKKGKGSLDQYRKTVLRAASLLLDTDFAKNNDSLRKRILDWADKSVDSLKEASNYILEEGIKNSTEELTAQMEKSDAEFQEELNEYLNNELESWIDENIAKTDTGLEDLTNRRIELLQQYSQSYSDAMASLFVENEYFDDWMNNMNIAFSGIGQTLGNVQGLFSNFFNEETGQIDFSQMKWEDWGQAAVMALQGASSILGEYAANYKEQMEAVLSSDEATEAEKEEAVKKYKNMMYAQTAIDMLAGITSAWMSAMQLPIPSNFIMGGISSALMLATGIASLTQIAAMDPTSENTVSGVSSSGGAGTPNVSTAIDSDAYTNTLSAQSQYDLQAGKSSDTRVYVLESDIQKTTNDVNVKVNESTF